jgi:FAD-dependent urate hydroxylase
VYDRVSQLRPAGAGISLWSNGVKVLNRLGLGAAIAQVGGQMSRMAYFNAQGEVLTDFSLLPLIEQVGQRPYPVTRTDLQDLLLKGLGPEHVHLNSQCIGVEETETGVTALFADGRKVTGDVLIGADGTHSKIREYVLGAAITRQYVGYVDWNGLVPVSADCAPDTWAIYVGDHKRVSMMPVGGDRFYFFFDVPLPLGTVSSADTYKTELAGFFGGWAAPVQNLIETLDPLTTNRVEIHDVEPLPALVRGRVALLGDAGHSTAPDLGVGKLFADE